MPQEKFLVAKHGGQWHNFVRSGTAGWFAEYYGDRITSAELTEVDREKSDPDLLASYDLEIQPG